MTSPQTSRTLPLPDGRQLVVDVHGADDLPLVLLMHGTPGGYAVGPAVVAAAAQVGVRVAALARPGYAGSTRLSGRTVADVVPDALAVADALGAATFAVEGSSGGGPHALALGALAADRCRAVATVAGVGPWDADGLDFLAGMGEGNEIEFGKALEGEGPLRALLTEWAPGMVDAGPQGTYDALVTVLSPPDRAIFTGEVARELHASTSLALSSGVDGWLDDDIAFTLPWGFAPQDVAVPTTVHQGGHDLMVPPAHAHWLAARIPGATLSVLPDDGHLTIMRTRAAEVLGGLAQQLR